MGEQQAPWTAIEIDQELCEHLFEALLALSRDEPGISRASYGEGEELAHRLVQDTGTSLGLTPAVDAAGNLYLTLDGADPGLPAWMIGSHLDSVAHGGNFDGAAGVIGGLAAVAALQGAGIRPKRPLTVVAFRAEESTWFPASYIGSRAAFGLLDRENLQVRRVDTGLSLYDHMAALGLDPEMVAQGRSHLDPNRIHGFVEIHIEQGPTLENAGIQIGLVTGISGSFRYRQARCLGTYAHSGAVDRRDRNDAVFALAALISGLDSVWGGIEAEGGRATVTFGEVSTDPHLHAFAKIPGEVRFCLDVRSAEPKRLIQIERAMEELIGRIEKERGVRFELGERTASTPALLSSSLVQDIATRADALGLSYRRMASGAGHDTAVFANKGVPSTMIFVRNQNGSHNPDEGMRTEDLCVAAKLLACLVAEQ